MRTFAYAVVHTDPDGEEDRSARLLEGFFVLRVAFFFALAMLYSPTLEDQAILDKSSAAVNGPPEQASRVRGGGEVDDAGSSRAGRTREWTLPLGLQTRAARRTGEPPRARRGTLAPREGQETTVVTSSSQGAQTSAPRGVHAFASWAARTRSGSARTGTAAAA